MGARIARESRGVDIQKVQEMRFNEYELISRAVDSGLEYGVNRAFKHTDTPSRETIMGEARNAIMVELSTIIHWNDLPED